jgi:putative DNA primase/helicase
MTTPTSKLLALSVNELLDYQFPSRRVLLLREGHPVVRAKDIGEVFAKRGVGKTLFCQTLALIAASKASAFGFSSPEPSKVLYIDGEMSGEELRDRFRLLMGCLGIAGQKVPLMVLGADWQEEFMPRLDDEAGQKAIQPYIEEADLSFWDNRSCLLNPAGEVDEEVWGDTQSYLLKLRRQGKSTILVHHGNRNGAARGLGRAEDVMNWVLKLEHPKDYSAEEGCHFDAEYVKNRGFWGVAAAPFSAKLTGDGWDSESDSAAEIDGLVIQALTDLGGTAESKAKLQSKVKKQKKAVYSSINRLIEAGAIDFNTLTGGSVSLASR